MCSLSPSSLLPIKLKPGYSEKRSNSSNSLFVSKRRGQDCLDRRSFNHPRTYTLTHSDFTAKLTLAISHSINNSQLQGWANKIYRDEVVAEWKKVKGKKSLHVHCRISGGHFLLDMLAKFGYYIFCKELPVGLCAGSCEDGFGNHNVLAVW
ncbi:magnesium dechelatase SGR1, chloroplastic-like [Brassica napus]|uniref:magnesium dechelatase SGR1, chloroplastic-like n=1 Tax=Brassica napus TaxID=3708 RepID=UPI002078F2A2|nr:magnesium dechelatase SGR1, chloroplastic-like [Brassica napus]